MPATHLNYDLLLTLPSDSANIKTATLQMRGVGECSHILLSYGATWKAKVRASFCCWLFLVLNRKQTIKKKKRLETVQQASPSHTVLVRKQNNFFFQCKVSEKPYGLKNKTS